MSSALGVLWNTWDNFWQDTSISGVNNAGKARKSALRRIIWIVVFSLGLAGTIWALYTVYADYILYPVTTTITIQHKDKVFKFLYQNNQCIHNSLNIKIADKLSVSDSLQSEQSGLWEISRASNSMFRECD